jgi:hypothetical protein
MRQIFLSRNYADGLGSAGVLARSLRRPAEGLSACRLFHQKVGHDEPDTSRRDAGWKRPRRSRSPLSTAWLKAIKLVLPGMAALLLLAGCAHRYDITLTNSVRLTNVSKPVLDREAGVYLYKDVTGKEHKIMAGRVVQIDPHSSKRDY